MRTKSRITLDRCEALYPISPISGGYRYIYNMDYGANNILIKNSVATEQDMLMCPMEHHKFRGLYF